MVQTRRFGAGEEAALRGGRLLDIHVHDDPGITRVVLRGWLGTSTAERFGETVRRAIAEARGLVLLDLRDLVFVDPTGVSALARAGLIARTHGKTLLGVLEPDSPLSLPPGLERVNFEAVRIVSGSENSPSYCVVTSDPEGGGYDLWRRTSHRPEAVLLGRFGSLDAAKSFLSADWHDGSDTVVAWNFCGPGSTQGPAEDPAT